MDGQSMNLDGLLQTVLSNPEMMKSAMELAGKLSAEGGLQSILGASDRSSSKSSEGGGSDASAFRESGREHREGEGGTQFSALSPHETDSHGKSKHDTTRHRKLLEALCLYVGEDKKKKLELMIRILELADFASNMGL